jgi:hypothetical protein
VAFQPAAWLTALSALASGQGAVVAADSMPVRLELSAPSGCSSPRELLFAIQRRNGRVRLASDTEAALSLRVTIRADESGASGDLTVLTSEGETSARHVTGSSCQDVADALALTAALSLGSYELSPPANAPSSASESSPSASAPSAQATSQPRRSKPGPDAAPLRDSGVFPDRRSSSSRWLVEAGAQASLGQMVAPHVQAGGGLLGRVRLERSDLVSPSLTLSLTHTRNELFESSRHAGLYLTGVSLSACPISLRASAGVRLEPCAVASAAELKAAGRDLPAAETVSRSWWAAGALARLAVSPWADLAFEVEGGALVPLVERRFVVEPSGRSLGSTPKFAPFVTAGLAYAL